MKQNYKAFAPDISTGGTTIKDVGKQCLSRKHTNPFKLWKLLICLMAVLMPVGAWAGGSGTATDPWTGEIGYQEITDDNVTDSDGKIHLYMKGVTSRFQTIDTDTHKSLSRIFINTSKDVVLHVAGHNLFNGWHETVSQHNHRISALHVEAALSVTIKPWQTENSTIKFNGDAENAIEQTRKVGIYIKNIATSFIIDGAVAVIAEGNKGAGGGNNAPSVDMAGATVTLKNGAFFSIHGDYKDETNLPTTWEVENFASAGRLAYDLMAKYASKGYSINNVKVSEELRSNFNIGTLSETAFLNGSFIDKQNTEQKFIVPSKQIRDTEGIGSGYEDGSWDYKFFVNNDKKDLYYAEFTTTSGGKIPFAIREESGIVKGLTNIGAAKTEGNTYYKQLNELSGGNYQLNVSQYPHSGTLNATSDIILEGTNTHSTLNTTQDGLTLNGNSHTITLDGIKSTEGKIIIAGDVRLKGECNIATDITQFNDMPVYYCKIYYDNTLLATEGSDPITISYTNNGAETFNFPYTVESGNQKIIHAWLPVTTETNVFTVAKGKNSLSIEPTIAAKHNQDIYLADPVICINDNDDSTTDVKYNTLSEAFKAVKPGETIYFEGNYNAVNGGEAVPSDQITEGSTFTLDLKEHTFSINGQMDGNQYPVISSGKGTLILKATPQSGTAGSISGNYQIKGKVYTDIATPGNVHIGGIPVDPKITETPIAKAASSTSTDMPAYITYTINSLEVNAVKSEATNKTEYCLWVPQGSEVISPVKDEAGTIFAQIQKATDGNSTLIPLFDLNSYNITADATSSVTYGSDGNQYVAPGYGTEQTPAEIVTVAEDKYGTANILTVNGDAYVILKDIYKGLQTGDGKGIATKLEVTGTGNADIKTSGINSIGTITIASGATLNFSQLEETPATANALRFATINDQTAQGTLKVESGTLLAYLNDKKADQINVATATYTGGSVRAKFEKNTNRFKKEDNNTALYRTSFKVNEYYTPYDYEYTFNGTNAKITGKATSDRNGEIHLWLPADQTKAGKARFNSANQTTSYEDIEFSVVAKNDNNIAPAHIGLYNEEGTSKIGSYNTLAEAFEIIAANPNQNYSVGLLSSHSESSTICKISDDQKVTIDLNGHTLNCDNVTFETGKTNFMLITNTGKSTTDSDAKHASISGDITVSQNVYIGQNVHMEGIHVSMINPKPGEDPYKNVRRLLVKGVIFNKEYTYEYADQTVGFTVGQKLDESDNKTGVACLWLVESMYPQEFVVYGDDENAKNGLTVPGGELAIVAHSNGYTQLQPGGVVAEVNGNKYRTLSKAIDAANDPDATNSDIKLLADIQSQATFNITQSYAIDLNGHDLTFTQGGFNATNGNNLIIKDESKDKGILAGVIKLINKENVSVDPAVTIGGVVVDASQATPVNIYRLMVDGGANASLNTWVETPERDTDKQYGTTYEYTIPTGLANHSTTVKGYKVHTITNKDMNAEWKNEYADCNIVLEAGAVWDVSNDNGNIINTIHRLTIKEDAKGEIGKVITGDNTKITATDGIRYVRTFAKDEWSLIALPFTATDITKKEGDKVVSISPAADPGTSGHFWLHTIKNDGSTTDVTDSEMTANKVYVMKTPTEMEITFVSGPNQMLRRDKVLAPDPISGFVAYANGTLNEVPVGKLCYMLDAKGENFERTTGVDQKVSPFSGYLLADAATTKAVARFSLRSTPTANEEIEIAEDELQIRTEAGRIILTTETPVQVVICDLKGTVKFSGEIPAGDSSYEVGAGIYIINNQKVIVK